MLRSVHAQLWADDLYASPIMWTYTGTQVLTHAAWSPARPSVILLTGHSGKIEAWVRENSKYFNNYIIYTNIFLKDIIYKQDGPTVCQEIHSGPVHYLAPHHDGGDIVWSDEMTLV